MDFAKQIQSMNPSSNAHLDFFCVSGNESYRFQNNSSQQKKEPKNSKPTKP